VSVGARVATSNDASTLGNRAGVPTASHRSGRLMTSPWMIGLPILTATVLERRAPEPLGPTRTSRSLPWAQAAVALSARRACRTSLAGSSTAMKS
jgi:hypothetical protein